MKIGIIKERKNPPDERVPFTPTQCVEIMKKFPQVEVVVEPSDIRCFRDELYQSVGVKLQSDLSDCDVLMGVKEVPKDALIPNKTYFFFSHTIKEQPYNRSLLQTMLKKSITMIDYEALTHPNGMRVLGFGRYAGIVGTYNGFLALGLRSGNFNLKPAHLCSDKSEMFEELKKVRLPENFKLIVTGKGRVGKGALEVLDQLDIEQVNKDVFLSESVSKPVFCHVDVDEYYEKKDQSDFVMEKFFEDPTDYVSTFSSFASVANMFVACHFWDSRAPFLFTREDMRSEDWKIDLVADISCDIDGPVASTIRPSTIEDPLYGYNPLSEKETSFMDLDSIGVMAVDNLPCELPKDASEDFGENLLSHILPALIENDKDGVIERGTICAEGQLKPRFGYLHSYVSQTV